MFRAMNLIGLPVIAIDSGKRVGNVKDLWMDGNLLTVGIVLTLRRMFFSPKIVPWEQVKTIGEDAVFISNKLVIQHIESLDGIYSLSMGSRKLQGLFVLLESGHQLGRIEDVYFSEKWDKKIVGCELSDGFISDLRVGRKWLPLPEQIRMGTDSMIVPETCAADLKQAITFTNE